MRVILVEDQVLLREGLAGLFRDAGHEIVASVGTTEGIEGLVLRHQPDIVVLDIRLPPTFTDEAPGPLPGSRPPARAPVAVCSPRTSRARTPSRWCGWAALAVTCRP